MWTAVIAISLGAALGALLRWALGLGLNQLVPALPMGTLAANLIGGYLIGLALALFAQAPQLPPEWRLLVITGFLGGLTTFSTFSAEVVNALQQGRLAWAAATISLHVLGSLGLTLLGLATPALLRR
jgi:CrcB protein